MKFILLLLKRSVYLMAFSIVLLSHETAFSQTGIIVEPGENTIIDAMNAHPGDTLILQKGQEYLVSEAIEITVPTVIRGEAYSRDGTGETPAVIRGAADPGEENDFYLILAAADLTLVDLGFIGFTATNKQIAGVVGVTKSFINMEASGCIVQGCATWFVTNSFSGLNFLLHDNIHFNTSTTGWSSYGGWGGPAYGGDTSTNHTYNCTYFVGGEIFLSGSTGPTGWQHGDHNTYVNIWGASFHKSKMDGYKVQNSIFFNSHIKAYVGPRKWIDGTDTLVWGGDYVSYRQLGDTLNGDCSVFPHALDTVEGSGDRFVVITNNLKYNEPRVLDWNEANDVTTQPFMAEAMRTRASQYDWTIAPNWTPDDGTDYDPQFAMGELPVESFESSWAQRLDRMDPAIPDHEVAWRPGGEEQKDFIWPLPFDFTPTNEAILHAGDDGYPLGDLNWFGPEVVAAWEAGISNPLSIRKIESLELRLTNYPNPFSAVTTFSYKLPTSSNVAMKIYDVTGAQVATLVNEHQIAGRHEIIFDGAALSEGIYFCKIQAGKLSQHQKITLIR